jgi:hypothetical protein
VTGDAADAAVVARALGDVAALGSFFVIATGQDAGRDPGWRPFTDLHEDGPAVRGLVAAYARRLGTAEPRVAASILFQGVAARLWSPVVAAAVAHGVVPDLASLYYRWAPGAPVGLWLAAPGGWRGAGDLGDGGGELAACVHRTVLGQLAPLRAAIRALIGVADGLMWGNAASALAGVRHAAAVRPAIDEPLTGMVERLLTLPPLAGTGELVRPFAERPELFYMRRSCCLYYRVPPGGDYCGDCVLLDPERRARRWRAAIAEPLT